MNKLKKQGNDLLGNRAKTDSIYIRMIRFFNHKKLNQLQLGINKWLVLKALDLAADRSILYLSIDRTNWCLGNQPINLLCIGIVLENRKFIPLISESWDKKGNSNQGERIDLLTALLELNSQFQEKQLCIVGDREFIGKQWFGAMQEAGIDFVMRSRTGDYFQDVQKHRNLCSWELEAEFTRDIQKKKAHVSSVKLGEQEYYYHVQKNKKQNAKEPTITWISSLSNPFKVSKAFDKRWQIEVFFGDVKTKGFDLESMNFKYLGKALMMLSLCSIVYLCILVKGIEQRLKNGKTAIVFDKKMKKFYPRKSIVKLGYETFAREIGYSIYKLDRYLYNLAKHLTLT